MLSRPCYFWRHHLVLLAWTVLGTACAGLPFAEDFQVKDSGVQVARGVRIYWLNDSEVLFGGPTEETRLRKDGVAEPINRVSVWNIRTNQIRRFGELAGSLCYHEGYVVFWERDVATNRLWINYGTLGETTRQERGPAQGEFDSVTCRPIKDLPPRPEWVQDFAIRWLRPEHGLLVLGSASATESLKNTTISYCPRGEKARCVTTLLKRRESNGFEWAPFKGAYFVSSNYFHEDAGHPAGGYTRGPWPLGKPQPIWWLHVDGRVETTVLPPGPWNEGGSVLFRPTSKGIFVQSHNLGRTGLGNAGGYLVRNDGEVLKLVSAYIETSAISPNGCRAAYVHDPYDTYPRTKRIDRITLRVIELC
jgi:hypothetical protein